jgi:hypothetical protein
MWVASEVVSTRILDDRVRVIEKFIRIAQVHFPSAHPSSCASSTHIHPRVITVILLLISLIEIEMLPVQELQLAYSTCHGPRIIPTVRTTTHMGACQQLRDAGPAGSSRLYFALWELE